ncbi:MAG: DUF2953 domain-containing protein [Oscillospiraceae bacterium]|nr:DUF2953 domain-containing protein [Oscillospiraceae bacterium]
MIVYIICILLLLPLVVKAEYAEEKWSLKIRFLFFTLLQLGSKEKETPELPPKPNDDAAQAEPEPHPENPNPAAEEKAEEQPVSGKTETEKTADEEKIPAEKPETADTVQTVQSAPSENETISQEEPGMEAADAEKTEEKRFRFIPWMKNRLHPRSLSDILALAEDGLGALSPSLRFLTRHIHMHHIRLYLSLGTDDAAKTAQLYGRICAAVYPLLGKLQCWLDMQIDEFRILSDFSNDRIAFKGGMEIRVSPAAVIALALVFGWKLLVKSVQRFRSEKKEYRLRSQETTPI